MATDPTTPPAFAPARALADLPRRAWVEQIMGMPISIHLRGPGCDGPPALEAVADAFTQLRRVDTVFSVWRADSQVSRLRRGELAPADCDPDVREVVQLCEQARDRTGGWFDADLPQPGGGRRFDPTGLVKGWAIERAADRLGLLTEHDFLINAGGDVAVGCRRTDTPDWRVGIEDPADRARVLAAVPLRTGAVATSGTAARGAHIIDPTTGTAATALLSVTVIGPSLTWADVYATAAFARGPDCVSWLAGLPGHAAFVVGTDRTVTPVTGP